MMSPAVGRTRRREKIEQCRFSATVVPNEADARAVGNGELEIGEQRSIADIVSDTARLKQRGHIRTGPS